MENLYPLPPPQSRMRNWRVLAFALLHLDLGGWRFVVPFYSVQDCRCSQPRRVDGHDVVHV